MGQNSTRNPMNMVEILPKGQKITEYGSEREGEWKYNMDPNS